VVGTYTGIIDEESKLLRSGTQELRKEGRTMIVDGFQGPSSKFVLKLCAMKAQLAFVLWTISLSWAVAQSPPGASIQELMNRSQAGDAEAQVELGRTYEDGKGVPQNDDLAINWFRKAAEQDNAKGQNSLGVMYALGRGVMRDRDEAVRWYRKAAKQGLPEAAYNLAIAYYNGEGAPEDLNLAYAWMMFASSRGDAQAKEALDRMENEMHRHVDLSKLILAAFYEKGEEVPKDLSAAVKIYLELGREDYQESQYVPSVQFRLCQMYATGAGVPMDLAEAKAWCKKAAEPPPRSAARVVKFAFIVLARIEERDQNWTEAERWYEKAILAGDGEAFLPLARLKMQRVPSRQDEAYFWLYLAHQFGVTDTEGELQQVASRLSAGDISKQQKRAQAWLREHAPQKLKNLKQP